jgi:hypothetical protein
MPWNLRSGKRVDRVASLAFEDDVMKSFAPAAWARTAEKSDTPPVPWRRIVVPAREVGKPRAEWAVRAAQGRSDAFGETCE